MRVTATVFLASGASAQDYDLVISNGRLMDPETLYGAVTNVGVTDGRIVVISTAKPRDIS
ncbi:hypothetical protein [Ruegeria aquimaris]|uniref:TonB-dependent receptor n=1 Tax=Ruegeria aquimaris TaxID=2984333 RepID=A0ABT3ALJ0_9RHOB|nr:hypothetical protein [Ruegeria sp. XHP0148]MCV2889457.1 hypothetical protein [Ruegeria sp. XHP0148]